MNLDKKPTPEQIETKLYHMETINVVLVVIVALMAFPLLMLWNANSANKDLIAEYSKGRVVDSKPREEVRYIVQPKVEVSKRTITESELMYVRYESCMGVVETYKGLLDTLAKKY